MLPAYLGGAHGDIDDLFEGCFWDQGLGYCRRHRASARQSHIGKMSGGAGDNRIGHCCLRITGMNQANGTGPLGPPIGMAVCTGQTGVAAGFERRQRLVSIVTDVGRILALDTFIPGEQGSGRFSTVIWPAVMIASARASACWVSSVN